MGKTALFATGILVGSLAAGAIAAVAAPAAAPAKEAAAPSRKNISLPGRTSTAPFSDGVMVGDTLYLAGRLGTDPKTGKPPADPDEEARLALGGIKATLAEAGMTMDDLVSVQVFCSDVTLFDRFNAVYRTFFGKTFPARAFIGSGPLLRGARFEVQGIAARR